jgi:mycothiol synthase
LDVELSGLADRIANALDSGDVEGASQLLAQGQAAARSADAGPLVVAAEPAEPVHDALAERAALTLRRELLQLRRQLPLSRHAVIAVRAFRPGIDDAAWLAVNNRAFAWHPDQGGWSAAELHSKTAEPWFDPDGFLLHEIDGRLAGFCWTKIHRDVEPALGEIFVIAVDPDHHRHGLGEQLTLAGLDWLADHGLQVAMLYVEADNKPARSLYERLGFDVHHAKRWWVAESNS